MYKNYKHDKPASALTLRDQFAIHAPMPPPQWFTPDASLMPPKPAAVFEVFIKPVEKDSKRPAPKPALPKQTEYATMEEAMKIVEKFPGTDYHISNNEEITHWENEKRAHTFAQWPYYYASLQLDQLARQAELETPSGSKHQP